MQLPSSVFQSVCQSVCLSFHLSLCLSIHLKIGSTFPNGDYALVRGFCITILAQCSKTVFASLLLITYLRLGVALLCLFLIVMHEPSFGAMIPFCDLEINFDKNFIKQTICPMIFKLWCWKLFFFFFLSETASNYLLSIWHL